jgi:pilus assembly protein CpaB
MNKKALIAAVVAALLGAGLLFLYMKRYEKEASGGPPVPVVMATQDIQLGAALTKEMIGIRTIPQAYVEDRHIRRSDAQDIIGVRVSNRLKANESVLWTDLATTTQQRRDLSSLVRPNMRAVTIMAQQGSSLGGLLQPGDRVDILLTTFKGGQPVTVPLLQNVLVLAVGSYTGTQNVRSGGQGRSANQVTLSVTVQQSAVVTYAQRVGSLSLTLRNPDDIAILEDLPETDRDDILEQEQRQRVQRRRPDNEPQGPTQLR